MFELLTLVSLLWILVFFVFANHKIAQAAISWSTFMTAALSLSYLLGSRLFNLVNNLQHSQTSFFNALKTHPQYPYGMREGLNSLLDTTALGFHAFIVSGAVTTTIFIGFLGAKPNNISLSGIYALLTILAAGFLVIITDSLILMFISFEMLLLASLYLLRLTSKSERVVEASIEMFFWTLTGSLALFLSFTWMYTKNLISFSALLSSPDTSNAILLLTLVGFGVKIPIWPFFSWLLKAHVEASVEFSILLSGFIIKAGVWGVYRLIQHSNSALTMNVFTALCLVGILVALCRILAQRDLKRIVALTTVIEMNWVGLCLSFGNHRFDYIAVYLVAVHSVITSLEFLVVEIISKRYNTRDLTQVNSLFYTMPLFGNFAFFTTLITIGFPGTPLFLAKLLFFIELLSVSYTLSITLALVLLLVLPLIFMKIWVPVWFGLSRSQNANKIVDLSLAELALLSTLSTAIIITSLTPGLLFTY